MSRLDAHLQLAHLAQQESKSVLEVSCAKLAKDICSKSDALMCEAASRFLKREWTFDELVGRADIQRLPSGVEVFCIDGQPLLELCPLENPKHEANSISVGRRYRFLIKEAS